MCGCVYKRRTEKDANLSRSLLFLLQCTVSNDCFYKLSLVILCIFRTGFYNFHANVKGEFHMLQLQHNRFNLKRLELKL